MRRLLVTISACAALAALVPAPATAAQPSKGRVLATGDSMIQILDVLLARRLEARRFKLRSDAHVGTGISKNFLLDWVRHSRKIAAAYRPTATVVFLGANEGFPMRYRGRSVQCCSSDWVRAYAARARLMMRSFARDGNGRVYWLTLPAARPHNWAKIYRRVNRALEIAARKERGHGVRLLDMGRIFTPNGRFRRSLKRHGHRVVVRQSDGIHLNRAGAGIAAGVVMRAMRRDGVFR
jgi:hypothetical protein